MDVYLVEQICSEQMPGDIGAQHQDVLVPRGLLGAPDRGLQPVEGKGPAVVAEEVLPRPMGDHEAGHTGPRRAAPRAYTEIERAPSEPSPIGSSSLTFGPAVNPSRDIDTSSTTLLIANLLGALGAAVWRR